MEEFELGVKEPESVPLGHMSLRTTLKFFTDCHMKKLPVKDLAEKYSIDEENISKLGFNYVFFCFVEFPLFLPLFFRKPCKILWNIRHIRSR